MVSLALADLPAETISGSWVDGISEVDGLFVGCTESWPGRIMETAGGGGD